MKVLVACEFSGRVRDAFLKRGHDAWSCDFLETESPGPHIQGDVLEILDEEWDLMIAHPPCKYLAVSGARWFYHPEDRHLPTSQRRPHPKFPNRKQHRDEALQFVRDLLGAPIPHITLENPVSLISSMIRKPDQYIHPWMFGHGEVKKTGFWLKNLPLLEPTNIVSGREKRVWKEPPGPNQWRNRSRTYLGVAEAMADQWGSLRSSLS